MNRPNIGLREPQIFASSVNEAKDKDGADVGDTRLPVPIGLMSRCGESTINYLTVLTTLGEGAPLRD